MKSIILTLSLGLLYGCVTNYPDEGVFSTVSQYDGHKYIGKYGEYDYYQFRSHIQYFSGNEKKYKQLVKNLISKLIKNKNICKEGYFVPNADIGGSESGNILAIIACYRV